MTEQEPARRKTPVAIYLLIGCGVIAGGFILLVPLIAGFLVPMLLSGREEATKIICATNLRRISMAMNAYALESGNGRFPHSPEGGIASLQVLADAGIGLDSDVFVCRASRELPAPPDAQGKFHLTLEACSYEAVPAQLRAADIGYLLAYEREPNHRGQRNVVFTDGAVELVDEAKFQQLLAKARARAAAAENRPAPGEK